jgi:hypothetical protein
MLLQVDGSPHDWLEGRGPRLTLHAAIDDATGKLVAGCFRLQEDAAGYLELFRSVVLREGVPLAVYHDRHDIFVPKPNSAQSRLSRETIEEQLRGSAEPTQVGRVLIELGIRSIEANSPQAKGRVERLFQTLQDRLVKWLREKGVSTLEEANALFEPFRSEFNARFAVPAADPTRAYRPLPEGFSAETVFCLKYLRTVAPDNTIGFAKQRIQLLADDRRTSYVKARVEVHERLDDSLAVYHEGRLLATRAAPSAPKELRARRGERPSPRPLVSAARSVGTSSMDRAERQTTSTGARPAAARAEAEPSAASEASQAKARRSIEQSKYDALTASDALTLERDGDSAPEASNQRAPVVGYVDKWTGERVVPPSPSPTHPWRRPLKARPNRPPVNQARVTESLNA